MVQITTSDGRWQKFCDQIIGFLRADITEQYVDGKNVRGYRSPDNPALWIRDHSDIVRGGMFVEADVKSSVECFASHQSTNGRVFDYVLTSPLSHSNERENWEKWIRIPVEADVEYRFVKAAFLAWRATGDDSWLQDMLPSLDLALRYMITSPERWSEEHGLVKRAYTIDTWDFDYTAGRNDWLNFQITPDTFWGIFHGDNSGFFEAATLLSGAYQRMGFQDKADEWLTSATNVRDRANQLLFNGRFYTHFHKISDVHIDGVDESSQLSLSNPMAINRGLATSDIAVAILDEYRGRRESTDAFAEWFIIDPPFPNGVFGDDKLVAGGYVNGGIFPLCGGELARAAFHYGREAYGIEILEQYRRMILESNATYLWYFHDGTPSSEETSTSPDATPTDGWGSSAMLYGLIEGLAGVVDNEACFQNVTLSPRWLFAGEDEASICLAYEASGEEISYHYCHEPASKRIDVRVSGSPQQIAFRVPVPADTDSIETTWNNRAIDCNIEKCGTGTYAVGDTVSPGTGALQVVYT